MMNTCDWIVEGYDGTRRPCANSGGEMLLERAFCRTHFRKMQDLFLEQIDVDPRFRDRVLRQVQESDLQEARVWTGHRREISCWPGPTGRAHAVYFIEREGFCKIGRTSDVEGRAREIARGSCMPDGMTVGPVRVLALIYCNCDSVCVRERFYQKKFKHLRYQLEWFLLDDELQHFIGGLAGCLDDELRAVPAPGSRGAAA